MIKYRAEIDGLRTVAVIPVVLFHLDYSFVKGGFYGVDVFFVISGYLITKILTNEIENGNFSMYRFWIRRVKRLLPLLLTVILVTLTVAPLLIFKPVVIDVSKDIFPALFSYSNFHALYDFGDYWGVKSEQSFFLHTWSLSVEEQFYLLYPFFLFFAYKYFKNFIIPILIITIVSLFLFFFYLKIYKDVDTVFYMLPTRIWELSLGGLVGIIQIKHRNKILPIIGIIFIVYAYLYKGIVGFSILFPVIGSSLIILFCTPNDIIGKILSTKIFVFVGKISYSLYLWHWVIIVLFKNLNYQLQDINYHIINLLIILLTFLFAYLSYTFVENKTRNYQHTPKIVLAGIALITGLTFYFQSDLYNPYYETKYNKQISYISYYSISPRDTIITDLNSPFYYNVSRPLRLQKFKQAYKEEGIITNKKNGTPEIILIGDSHGVMWAKLIDEISDKLDVTLSCYASNGDKPFFNIADINAQEKNRYFSKKQKKEYAISILQNIEKWNPKLIILAYRSGINEIMKEQFNELLSYLENRDISVLLFTQPPELKFMKDQINSAQYFTYLGINPINGYNLIKAGNQLSVTEGNDYLKSLKTKYSNVNIYDVYENMILNNKVKISLDNNVFYFDDDHLSVYGTYEHRKNISELIKTILNTSDNKNLQRPQ